MIYAMVVKTKNANNKYLWLAPAAVPVVMLNMQHVVLGKKL